MKIANLCRLGLLSSLLLWGIGCMDTQQSLPFVHPPSDAGIRDAGVAKSDSGAAQPDGGSTPTGSGPDAS